MIIIIISVTTNFIAAFHGLYLLAAHSHSFQLFLFSFWVEHMENGLQTMSKKMCYPKGKNGYYILLHDMTVHLLTTTENAMMLVIICLWIVNVSWIESSFTNEIYLTSPERSVCLTAMIISIFESRITANGGSRLISEWILLVLLSK